MNSFVRTAASCPVTVLAGIFSASAGAMAAAIYAQFALHLEPCQLCLYQRMPYVAAMLLSLIGLAFRNNAQIVKSIIALCGVAFLIDAGVAIYHTGVERKWWASQVEGCAVPDFTKHPDLLQKILTAPAASCHDIAWADPFMGLTMANYNAVFALALFTGCVAALAAKLRPEPSERP